MVRVMTVGTGVGLLLIVVMCYPLYVVLPSQYVAEWPGGSPGLAFLVTVGGGLLLLISGAVAAYWSRVDSRKQGAWRGAIAGAVSGSMLFAGLGAAAGVMGSELLLAHGPKPAVDDKQFAFFIG